MKKQKRYKILNYAKREYSKIFGRDYQFKDISKNKLNRMLIENKHSYMCEWSYCCCGLYKNCWQEPIEEGCWGMTQLDVDKHIKYIIDSTAKICKRDNRILFHQSSKGVDIIIVTRDVLLVDYVIHFTNNVEY